MHRMKLAIFGNLGDFPMLGLKNRPVFSNKTGRKDNKKENPFQSTKQMP